jgi:alpha-1,2-mannosyltransferase
LGSNAYVWLSLILLVAVPLAPVAAPAEPKAVEPELTGLDRELADVTRSVRVPAQEDRRLVEA